MGSKQHNSHFAMVDDFFIYNTKDAENRENYFRLDRWGEPWKGEKKKKEPLLVSKA